MRAPALSRNPRHIMEPLSLNEGPPERRHGFQTSSSSDMDGVNEDIPRIVTTTGLVLRLSWSGSVMAMVRTEPKLVPIHKVGISNVGSVRGRAAL